MTANRLFSGLIKSHKGIYPLGFGLHNSFNYYSTNNFDIITNLDDALNVFDKMTKTHPLPSIVSFTKLLNFVTNMNHFSCSIHLFKHMCSIGVPFDSHTASIVINSYCSLFDNTVESLTLLASCFKRGILLDVSTYNTILHSFILEDRTHESETLFKKLIRYKFCEPDIVTYNTMINGLCKIGNNYTAIALLRLMNGRGCTPNHVSYNTIIDSLCKDLIIDDAFKLFKEMVSHKNIPPNADTYNSLIFAFCKLGRWDDSTTMLKQMEDKFVSPNVITFNILVDAFCKQDNVKEAQAVCDLMVESANYPPDIVTYNSLIRGYLLQDKLCNAKNVFDHMVFRGIEPNDDTDNRFMDWFSQNDMLNMHYDMYKSRGVEPKYNRVSQYIESDYFDRMDLKLLSYLNERPSKQFDPDICDPIDEMQSQAECIKHRYNKYLQSFCDEYGVASALDLFHFMDGIGRKLNSNIDVYNILIDGANECWKFDTARRLFHDVFVKGIRPDYKTYRRMIKGFCVRGLLRDAKQLFLKIKKGNCRLKRIIIKDLIRGYSDNKPSDDVAMLLRELEARGYEKIEGEMFIYLED